MADTPGPSQAAVDGLLASLSDVIKSATSPDVQAAQALLLRRLAVEGDVIPSRLPSPRNITEMGGYLNLVTQLGRDDLRAQMLAALLGVAGRSPLAGWEMPAPPLALVPVANDRPPGTAGSGVTASVLVRADLAGGLCSAMQSIHAAGGILPLWSPPPALPPAAPAAPGVAGAVVPDPLLYLGRALWVAPSAALIDPETDPVVVGRTTTDPGTGYRLALRVNSGTPDAPPADWTALQWDQGSGAMVDRHLGTEVLLALDQMLAAAGYATPSSIDRPQSRTDYAWARLVNAAGLLPGVTSLYDELSLAYPAATIASSVFAAMADWIWDGTAFSPTA
jgi:hypothetical protein